MAFLIFFFFVLIHMIYLPPLTTPIRMDVDVIPIASKIILLILKKNYFGHDGMSFLFFLKKKRGGNFGHLYLSAKPIYLPRRVRLSLLSSVLFGEDGRNWKYL